MTKIEVRLNRLHNNEKCSESKEREKNLIVNGKINYHTKNLTV